MNVMTTLYVREGLDFREAESNLILAQADALISRRFCTGARPLTQPEETRHFLRLHLGGRDHEVFGLLHLTSRLKLIAVEDLFRGTIDQASVHTREVVKSVLAHGSTSVIIFHNHPSGACEPSKSDEAVTRKLREVLALIEVRVLDHLIVGEKIFSFADHGML
jgi:DNA repair protein RadC